ncbi:MAG: HAD family hydrolase [Pyrinomonadaceae bacterium]
MRTLAAVVFDLDDTLYFERDYVSSGFQAVAVWADARLGIPYQVALSELQLLFDQGYRSNTFDRWIASGRVTDVAYVDVSDLVAVYRAHAPLITPAPGVQAALETLRKQCRLGLLSDGHLVVQRKKLSALGLAKSFDAVVFTDEFGRSAWKPATKGFVILLERLGVQAAEAVYVGDNPLKDFLGARSVGMKTVRVRNRRGLYSDLEPPSPQFAPDIEVATLDNLLSVL